MKEILEDEKVFGKDAWIYCGQHLNAHQTGWCKIGIGDKLGLGIVGADKDQEAIDKCLKFGLRLYGFKQASR